MENWYEPYFNHKNMVVACVLARHFNQPTTLEAIGFPDSLPRYAYRDGYWDGYVFDAQRAIYKLKEDNQTVFNGAYIIRASADYANKSEMVFRETCQQFIDRPLALGFDSMEGVVCELMTYRNIGSFMAGQIAADLRWAVKGKWSDKDTWAAMGPGSKRGMNRLHGREVEAPLNQEHFLNELQGFKCMAEQKLPKSITSRMEMIDWQNCFCEVDKYTRVLLGEGRAKQRYNGGSQ
jgi:hypothetical protein